MDIIEMEQEPRKENRNNIRSYAPARRRKEFPVHGHLPKRLNHNERQVFKRCEADIQRGLDSWFIMAKAIRIIRAQQLWRGWSPPKGVTPGFRQYMRGRWGMTVGRAIQFANASRVYENLIGYTNVLPKCESQLRDLVTVKDPKVQREIWCEAAAIKNGVVTAELVKKIMDERENKGSDIRQKQIQEFKNLYAEATLRIRQALNWCEAHPNIDELPDDGEAVFKRLAEAVRDLRKY